MHSGILRHGPGDESRDALYAELRMRSARRRDWRRLQGMAMVVFVVAAVVFLFSYLKDPAGSFLF